jgi:hypothetical protein
VLVGWQGTVGAWPSVLAGEVAELAFYVEGAGFDDPLLRLAEVAAWSAMWLLVLSLPLAVAWLARETKAPWVAAAAGLAMLVGLALSGDQFAWRESVRPLTLVAISTAFALAAARWRGARTHRNLLALALTEFSLALLAKMLLNVRAAHYGFALAMPATLLVVALLVGWAPAWLARRGARGDVFLACALAVLTVFSARHVAATADWMARKTETVGSGRDAFRADARGALVRVAAGTVRASGAATLAVLPRDLHAARGDPLRGRGVGRRLP